MKRMISYLLTFSMLLVLLVGCGKNRPKRPPVLIDNEADYIFDDRVNTNDDMIQVLQPQKGPLVEFEVTDDMLIPGFPWNDSKFFTKKPKWPDSKGDQAFDNAVQKAQGKYDDAFENYKGDLRKKDMLKIGEFYLDFATNAKRNRAEQSLESWYQYLRRKGPVGEVLRKQMMKSVYEMTMTADVSRGSQIIARSSEPEKNGANLIITTNAKDAGGAASLNSLKSGPLKDACDEQAMSALGDAYFKYGEELTKTGGAASKEGFRTFVKTKHFPQLAKYIEDNAIKLVDFTQAKLVYVAWSPILKNDKGALTLGKSGGLGRQDPVLLQKLFPD